ncbi:uncharacterized protein TRUGW13939_10990 [Talaromyces rugulosus]|uniref:Major facilitator superfamily (MFS) profile domain-containing protein n=1 Tax=Talaromyces rugulosus TaxID=121627 RepID=A0A7H8RBI7_TALRU|nr:uncharacterized protein TRUGW13939_10990 [Talaromyces rugulosus]QKX63819.1 hypothetical protein TRUGW13939_10990 [Talaromyces rugulosus]
MKTWQTFCGVAPEVAIASNTTLGLSPPLLTTGLLLASCVVYATENDLDSRSYRIPIGIQWLWTLILFIGLLFLPESPRYFVKKGNIKKAQATLARVRGQLEDSKYIRQELAEIVANHEYELHIIGTVDSGNLNVVKAQISSICIYIAFFASTWGPEAWVVTGEMFPLPIRGTSSPVLNLLTSNI